MSYDASLIDKELRAAARVAKLAIRPSMTGFRLLNRLMRQSVGRDLDGAASETVQIERSDGTGVIRTRIFRPNSTHTSHLPIVVYFHGGGYAIGAPEQDSSFKLLRLLLDTRPCVIVAPDFRGSLEAPYPAGFNDCYDTVLWTKANADALGGRSDQIMIVGDSGGGGLAIASCLRARDSGDVNIAFQMPLYPMIDDQQTNPSAIDNTMPVWNSKFNKLGWDLYLRDLRASGTPTPAYAAPARSASVAGLPPAATFVGRLDPFHDETVDYVNRLKGAGIPIHFKQFEGCFHGFEVVAPKARVSREAVAFIRDAFAHAVDSYRSPQGL